ncbi:MAG: hypothetical protein NC218_02040 [Acetobacter sp.]|nr:hypothetical protein [Acetobacter sp.]
MHIRMFEFPKAKDVVHWDEDDEQFYICGACFNTDDFWCEGSISLYTDYKRQEQYVEARLTLGDFEIATTGPIYCKSDKENKQDVISAYNKAVKELKALYTEWVYKNIIDGGITTPTA